jgi:hypothetical protein
MTADGGEPVHRSATGAPAPRAPARITLRAIVVAIGLGIGAVTGALALATVAQAGDRGAGGGAVRAATATPTTAVVRTVRAFRAASGHRSARPPETARPTQRTDARPARTHHANRRPATAERTRPHQRSAISRTVAGTAKRGPAREPVRVVGRAVKPVTDAVPPALNPAIGSSVSRTVRAVTSVLRDVSGPDVPRILVGPGWPSAPVAADAPVLAGRPSRVGAPAGAALGAASLAPAVALRVAQWPTTTPVPVADRAAAGHRDPAASVDVLSRPGGDPCSPPPGPVSSGTASLVGGSDRLPPVARVSAQLRAPAQVGARTVRTDRPPRNIANLPDTRPG